MITGDQLALANHVLTLSLIATLRQKNLLGDADGSEMIEQALLLLETHQKPGHVDDQAFAGARGLLEQLRLSLS